MYERGDELDCRNVGNCEQVPSRAYVPLEDSLEQSLRLCASFISLRKCKRNDTWREDTQEQQRRAGLRDRKVRRPADPG